MHACQIERGTATNSWVHRDKQRHTETNRDKDTQRHTETNRDIQRHTETQRFNTGMHDVDNC